MADVERKPGYKQTKLGWIPEEWRLLRLEAASGKVMVGIAGAATHAYRDSGIVLLRNLNIKENRIDESDVLYIDPGYEKQHKGKRIETGDVITVRTGYPGLSAVATGGLQGPPASALLPRRRTRLHRQPEGPGRPPQGGGAAPPGRRGRRDRRLPLQARLRSISGLPIRGRSR